MKPNTLIKIKAAFLTDPRVDKKNKKKGRPSKN